MVLKKQLLKIKELCKWFFSNPGARLRQLNSFISDGGKPMGNFTELIRNNIDRIDLITFEDFCKKFNIKVKKEDIVIPHTPRLLGSRVLIMTFSEIYTLCMLAKGINAKKIFEIGTFEGETISNVAHNVADDTEIYSLDLPLDEIVDVERSKIGRYIKEDPKADRMVKILYGNSLNFDFSSFHRQIDMMFIDGGTSYECIRSDSENAVKCVKEDGFIVWHDFLGVCKNYLGLVSGIFEIVKKHDLKLHLIDGTRIVIAKNTKNYEYKHLHSNL